MCWGNLSELGRMVEESLHERRYAAGTVFEGTAELGVAPDGVQYRLNFPITNLIGKHHRQR
jgi:hypothetical protein